MSTGERIVYEALVLFSKKGYSDVYVAEIASAVGIKAPSLYKHFKSKQDIFDECAKFFTEEWKMPLRRIMLIMILQISVLMN